MNYYISDIHYNDERIKKLCKRPFRSVQEMHEKIIYEWNAKVSMDDNVYIIGDLFSDNNDGIEDFLKKLKGNKFFIIGNHDHDEICRYQHLFEQVDTIAYIDDEGRHVTLCHYPLVTFAESTRAGYHVYGHIHNNPHEKSADFVHGIKNAFNSGVDVNEFRPMSLDELIAKNEDNWVDKIICSKKQKKKIIAWINNIGEHRYKQIYDAVKKGTAEVKNSDLVECAKYESRLSTIIFKSFRYVESYIDVILNTECYFHKGYTQHVYDDMSMRNKINMLIDLPETVIQKYKNFNYGHNHLRNNLLAINRLRNIVCHNSLLLNNKSLFNCGFDNSNSLKSNIINLLKHLPDNEMIRRRVKEISGISMYEEDGKKCIVPRHIAIDIELNEVLDESCNI